MEPIKCMECNVDYDQDDIKNAIQKFLDWEDVKMEKEEQIKLLQDKRKEEERIDQMK